MAVAAADRRADPGARMWLWVTVGLSLGAVAVAIALAPATSRPPMQSLAWLLFLGSSVHVASTGWLYTCPEVRAYAAQRPVRYVVVPIALVVGSAVTAAALSPGALAWLLLFYFAWQFFHFQKQNLGMAALAASSQHLPSLRPIERRALVLAGGAGILGLMARPALLQLRVDPGIGLMFSVARGLFIGAVALGLVTLSRRPARQRPIGFCTVYALSLLFFLPVFVCGSPYAAVGGMTIAHGLQYLFLLALIACGGRRATRAHRLVVLCNVAVVGGALLSGASHLHNSAPAARLLFGAYLGAVMAHFVIDAGLWRLRDAFPRLFVARYLPSLLPASGEHGAVASPGSSADIR